ncbi:MAG: hypothetical protein MK105_16185 [Crocinitomicaceae bacterium]|nr:hypothetical protein [Crocinitomicaceae bacterium]
MKKYLIFILILLSSTIYSQVNIDSVMNELLFSGNFHKTDTIPYLTESFYRYRSLDETKSYDVYTDSLDKLNEYVGLSMVYREYDIEGRTTKRIGYNLKGNYYLWDYSPIIHTQYSNDTTTKDYYNYQYVLQERIITIMDSSGRVIETLRFDKNLELSSQITNVYDDSINQVLITSYDGNGKYRPDKLGVSIRLKKYNPNDPNTYLEEYFYDSKMRLIDGDHNNLSSDKGLELKYSQLKRKNEEGDWITSYFNAKGEMICEESFGDLIILK